MKLKRLFVYLIVTLSIFSYICIVYANPSAPINNNYFNVSKIKKNKDSVITIDGTFINTTKNRIYNFKNITLELKQKNGILLKKLVFNDDRLKSINLLPGNFVKWTFGVVDKDLYKKLNVKNTLVYCNFDYLTEFDNSTKNGLHIVLENKEIYLNNVNFVNQNNKVYIPLESLLNIKQIIKTKKIPIHKNFKNINPSNSSTLINQYTKLNDFIIYIQNSPYVDVESIRKIIKNNKKIYYKPNAQESYFYIVIYH